MTSSPLPLIISTIQRITIEDVEDRKKDVKCSSWYGIDYNLKYIVVPVCYWNTVLLGVNPPDYKSTGV